MSDYQAMRLRQRVLSHVLRVFRRLRGLARRQTWRERAEAAEERLRAAERSIAGEGGWEDLYRTAFARAEAAEAELRNMDEWYDVEHQRTRCRELRQRAEALEAEVEDERHNFDALNIPPAHPARDELDNFYIDPVTMLRSHTSTVQIRTMECTRPPVRIISPGRVYRPDTVDATHSFMFHQVEGLYVDEGVTMADLKTCLDQFCKTYFGQDIVTCFRPSFFPFTEPSAEVDIEFHRPDGTRYWVELGGCGMVDPNVLAGVGYDTEKYTGFAFGLGIERMIMRKHRIPDIRLLFESDVRFLHQF